MHKLVLRNIIKIAATSCNILELKCTKSISAGAPPQTPLGELRAGFKGATSNRKGGLAIPTDDDDLPHDVIERDDDNNDIAQTVS